jgi:DNA primase large subunit
MRGFKCNAIELGNVPKPFSIPDLKDEVTLARYPFLPQAKEWIAKMATTHEIDIDELLDGSMMERARVRARSRLVDSVDSKDGVEVASIGDIHTEEGRLLEAFSFYYARLVVGASEDERLISRWAQAEAERAQHILDRDDAIAIIASTYISEIECDKNGVWRIGLADFIELCTGITGSRWRLPNCDIKDGWVTLFDEGDKYSSKGKVARLLRERMKDDIRLDAIEKMAKMDESLLIRLSEPVGMIRGLVASRTAETIALIGAGEEDWPPCMRKAVSELAEGVNVNHFGRVFLGSMSRCIGLPAETTVDFFRAAPDFNESTTTYQVGHLYEREYTPSGCSKLKVNHNCAVRTGEDRLCDQPWMDHPLKYIRAKQRRRKKQESVEVNVIPPNSGDA